MTLEQLENFVKEQGQPKFRAGQLFQWLHGRQVDSFSEMTDQPKSFLSVLEQECTIERLAVQQCQISKDGTRKYLFSLPDGNCIETVWMQYSYGNTVCVSTQVGCRMGCRFCASTQGGKVRDLTAGEIAGEIYAVMKDTGQRVSHIVLMGIGEPLDNFENVLDFLSIISSPKGVNIGMRNISLSTCGLVPKIKELAQKKLQLTLSVSLHAPLNEMRSKMMPVNDAYPIEELIKACKSYIEKTNRRISFEYALAKENNDNLEDAKGLVKLLKGMLCHVNLIPINKIENGSFTKSSNEHIIEFRDYLNDHGIVATIRRELGSDIEAACGQLRRKNLRK